MTVEELYNRIGGDYEEAIGRMRSEALVKRFAVKFLDDTSCRDLFEAWEAGDEAAAFEAAHAAKGVSSNLSFAKVASLTGEITEALRPGNEELRSNVDVDGLIARLKQAYDNTVEAIRELA